MRATFEETEFIELDELALSLINGGEFNPDTTPSGEQDPNTGKPMSCGEVFKAGHCSQQCINPLFKDWQRLKGQPATPAAPSAPKK